MKIKINSLPAQTGLILFLAVVSALVFNTLSPNGLSIFSSPPLTTTSGELTAEQARILLLAGKTLFIDTRYPEEFSHGHIPGAVNVPSKWSLDRIMEFFEPVSRDLVLVIYCGSAECNSSRRLAGFLGQLEFQNVLLFTDGFENWLTHKYPVDSTSTGTEK